MSAKNEVPEEQIELIADELTGNVQSFLVDFLRQSECALRYLPEAEQVSQIERAREAASYMVRRAVAMIAADGREVIPVRVKKVENDGEKVKVAMEANKEDQHRHELFDAAGCAAFLTVADPTKYEGGEAPKPTPDQGGLLDGEEAA